MPLYQYEVLNGKSPVEIIEIEETWDASPTQFHPLTNEPIKRIISSPSLTLRHSTRTEKTSLSKENLEKHGFARFQKNSDGTGYDRAAG